MIRLFYVSSDKQSAARLKEYENRSKAIFDFGLEEAELKNILEEFKTNPISLKSCGGIEKQSFMITEMEQLLIGNYDSNNLVIRLIKSYGYSDNQAQKLLDDLVEEIQQSGKLVLSAFDKVNERCKELAMK